MTGVKMREARVSEVFVVGIIAVKNSLKSRRRGRELRQAWVKAVVKEWEMKRKNRKMDSDPLIVQGSKRDLRLGRIQGQGGGKRKFGAFCAVQQCLSVVEGIGVSLPTLDVGC